MNILKNVFAAAAVILFASSAIAHTAVDPVVVQIKDGKAYVHAGSEKVDVRVIGVDSVKTYQMPENGSPAAVFFCHGQPSAEADACVKKNCEDAAMSDTKFCKRVNAGRVVESQKL